MVGLEVTASPAGYHFQKWQRNGEDFGTNASITVTMDADQTLTAVFAALAPSPLVNGSFESNYSGWTASGNQVIRTSTSGMIPDGIKYVSFNSGNAVPNGVLAQTFATSAGQGYHLDLAMGTLAFNTSEQRLQVEITGIDAPVSQVFSMNGIGGGNIRWEDRRIRFTASGPAATLVLRDLSPTSQSIDLLLDHVRLTPIVSPIPAAAAAAALPPGDRVPVSFARTGGICRIGVNATLPGRYELQRSRDLETWETIESWQVTEPGWVEFADDGSGEPRMFYRVGVSRSE